MFCWEIYRRGSKSYVNFSVKDLSAVLAKATSLVAGKSLPDTLKVLTFFYFCLLCFTPLFRLTFSRSQHHVTAQVFSSNSPAPVLSCSTKEWAVKKELASTNCVAACQAVGEVLAHRCQQAGITRMVYKTIPWTYRSDAVSTCRRDWQKYRCNMF